MVWRKQRPSVAIFANGRNHSLRRRLTCSLGAAKGAGHRAVEPGPPLDFADKYTGYLIQLELDFFLLLLTQSRQTAKLSQATLREISRCRSTWPADWHLSHCLPADLAMRSILSVQCFLVDKMWSGRKNNTMWENHAVQPGTLWSLQYTLMSFNPCNYEMGIFERVPG